MQDRRSYLAGIVEILKTHWPDNRRINIVCHGHSVPAGYIATPMVDSLNAYPDLLKISLKHRFPFAVINTIVTAIGGENSESGVKRFCDEVLCHRPDVITIDYGLNDRHLGLEQAQKSWVSMIESGIQAGSKILLMTPTWDVTQKPDYAGEDKSLLEAHARQIRQLADEYEVGLVDSFAAFGQYVEHGDLTDLLGWSNHPNRLGHELVVKEIMRWFPAG